MKTGNLRVKKLVTLKNALNLCNNPDDLIGALSTGFHFQVVLMDPFNPTKPVPKTMLMPRGMFAGKKA